MLGFQPLSLDIIKSAIDNNSKIPPGIHEINMELEAYKPVNAMLHDWIVLSTSDIDIVYKWRLEAEDRMRAQGLPALSPDQAYFGTIIFLFCILLQFT
jgi:pantothenate kinase-related protein Tda10